METQVIEAKRTQYFQQQQEALQRRAELLRVLENIDRQVITLGGAVQALDDLLEAATTVCETRSA